MGMNVGNFLEQLAQAEKGRRLGMSWQLAPVAIKAARDIARRLSLPQALGVLLAQRGCEDATSAQSYLGARGDISWMKRFSPPPSMRAAIKRLHQAQENGDRVVIYGDYDADGVSGVSILHRFFQVKLKLDVHVFLPSRFKEGYGLNAAVIPELAAAGTRLIVTADNGITAVEAAAACKAQGIDLIVTDHHAAKECLPAALALVHPRVDFPEFSALSGAGVAFMLCLAMTGNDVRLAGQLLDLACIGTLGDMVPLTPYNRSLVHLGLKRWNLNHKRAGTAALLDAYNQANPYYPIRKVTATDLAFVIAPLINAAGRMEHPRLAYDLLTAEDRATAIPLAQQLVVLNEQRKQATRELFAEVSHLITHDAATADQPFIVLAGTGWHLGIVGLVAGKVLEHHGRPVILLSEDGDHPGHYHGSGRAPKGVNLVELLARADPCLSRWGGHAQAAGCSVAASAIDELRQVLNTALQASGWTLDPHLPTADATVTPPDLNDALFEALDLLEPHGQENPRPLLALEDVAIEPGRVTKGHLFTRISEGPIAHDVVGWQLGNLAPLPPKVDLLFHLERVPDFRSGEPKLRLNLKHVFPAYSRQQSFINQ